MRSLGHPLRLRWMPNCAKLWGGVGFLRPTVLTTPLNEQLAQRLTNKRPTTPPKTITQTAQPWLIKSSSIKGIQESGARGCY